MINTLFSNPISFIFYIISLLVALSIHEASHAWVADRLGDPTSRLQGRISLNPLKHIDPMGALFLLFFGFGWGKPVEVDNFNLKHPRQDGAKIALAGPISKLALAVILSIVLHLLTFFHLSSFFIIGSIIIYPLITMNVFLGLFNLIPINPLDGFNIVTVLLPKHKAYEWEGLRRYGMIFLLLMIIPLGNTSMLDGILHPIASFILNFLIPVGKTGII